MVANDLRLIFFRAQWTSLHPSWVHSPLVGPLGSRPSYLLLFDLPIPDLSDLDHWRLGREQFKIYHGVPNLMIKLTFLM
jgi:hypothetical protein